MFGSVGAYTQKVLKFQQVFILNFRTKLPHADPLSKSRIHPGVWKYKKFICKNVFNLASQYKSAPVKSHLFAKAISIYISFSTKILDYFKILT